MADQKNYRLTLTGAEVLFLHRVFIVADHAVLQKCADKTTAKNTANKAPSTDLNVRHLMDKLSDKRWSLDDLDPINPLAVSIHDFTPAWTPKSDPGPTLASQLRIIEKYGEEAEERGYDRGYNEGYEDGVADR